MSWRILTIQNPAQISLQNKQLLIIQNEEKFTLPVEDLCVIVLDSPQINLTSALLGHLQKHNVAVITCDEKHTPNGLLCSFHQHSRQSEISHLQKNLALPLQKRLWQKLVQQKITNQAKCLESFGHSDAKFMAKLIEKVESGDKQNIEAYAARLYWPWLFNTDFKRHDSCIINGALNYGYAIIRSLISRSLVAYGLIPCFGIHHKNELNAFNLSDDIIEPFRPIVDAFVKNIVKKNIEEGELTKEMRGELVGVGLVECKILGEVHNLQNAVEKICSSLVSAVREKTPEMLQVPEFVL